MAKAKCNLKKTSVIQFLIYAVSLAISFVVVFFLLKCLFPSSTKIVETLDNLPPSSWTSHPGNCTAIPINTYPTMEEALKSCMADDTCQTLYTQNDGIQGHLNGKWQTRKSCCSLNPKPSGCADENHCTTGINCNTQQGGTTFYRPTKPLSPKLHAHKPTNPLIDFTNADPNIHATPVVAPKKVPEPQIDKAIYTGFCKGNPKTWDEASAAGKGRDITQQLQKAITNSMSKGAKSNAIGCFGDFKCPTNSNYTGSTTWWDDKNVGLGPEVCPGQYQDIFVKCKNGKTLNAIGWGSPVDLSPCV